MANGVSWLAGHHLRDAAGAGTAVHKTDGLAELVCSNSFRGDKVDNAVGLLKGNAPPWFAGAADRRSEPRRSGATSRSTGRAVLARRKPTPSRRAPLITVVREEVSSLPAATPGRPVIIATGPLTSEALSADIAQLVGGNHLYFYDAIGPIVLAEHRPHEGLSTVAMGPLDSNERAGTGQQGGERLVGQTMRGRAGKAGGLAGQMGQAGKAGMGRLAKMLRSLLRRRMPNTEAACPRPVRRSRVAWTMGRATI